MKTKKELKEFIEQVIKEFILETGPSAQGIIQTWLGPSLKDEEGIQMYDEDNPQPPKSKLP